MFKDIPGQERVKRILEGAIRNNRIPHAYLFTGPELAPKEAVARTLAKVLDVPYVLNLKPEGTTIKIEQIRELRQLIRYGPSEGRWLVAIIQEAEAMTQEAANSFLKALEEPPPRILFILITSAEDALPLTIISRCQKIIFAEVETEVKPEEWINQEFKNLKSKDLVDLLKLSEMLSQHKAEIEDLLYGLVCKYRSEFNLKAVKALMETIKSIKKRANLRLSLDLMCLKLKEVYV